MKVAIVKWFKTIFRVILMLYIIVCVGCSIFYKQIITWIGHNNIIYSSFQGKKYIVYLHDESVYFGKIKNYRLDFLGLSYVPIIVDKIQYGLTEPHKTSRSRENKKHLLADKDDLLANGLSVQGFISKNVYGSIETSYIYFIVI